jgi:putative SOS response-associated peptidase YedK
MCGRFALGVNYENLKQKLGFTNHVAYKPRYNIAPDDVVLVLRDPECLEFMSWGFLPSWHQGKPFINARFETITEKPTFAFSYKNNRCVIIASGYYEWESVGSSKQPYYVHDPQGLLYMAGIYSDNTCAVITRSATTKINRLHSRMPLLLNASEVVPWLQRRRKRHLDFTSDFEMDLALHKVSKRINFPSYDNPSCIEVLNL